MKKALFIFSICCSVAAFGQENSKKVAPPEGKALVGEFYGTDIKAETQANAVSSQKLQKMLTKVDKTENVAVQGKVTEVCEKKGCWLTVETVNNEKFFVKMKDYAFFVPTALVGKEVVLEGSAEKKVISVDEQKHYAEDAKKSQAEIDAITSPKEEIRFVANGIKVVK